MTLYTTQLLSNALNLVSKIYQQSMYDQNIDLFRIKDITDSLSQGQYESKAWAVNNLLPFIEDHYDECYVIGGWYGLFSYLLTQRGFTKKIKNLDLDPVCKEIGYDLLKNYSNISFKVEDGLTVFENEKTNNEHKIVVCTACEHIDQDELEFSLKMKNPNMLVCLQSNDFFDVDSHINCKESLSEFVKSLPLNEVLYAGEWPWKDEYNRFMVIGK